MHLTYPTELPISPKKDEIIDAIKSHQVIIVSGDTGSGKTTQLPKMCLEAFPENEHLIGCTQPRRIAATSVSQRVSEELGQNGHMVGYKIRFHDHTDSRTKIKFMTDGVLLAETRNDRKLSAYGILIIDEAHERSLNIDFLLGYLKQLLPKRPDLKVIITSATIDTAAFSSHFDDAPIISVSGRNFPVKVEYQPLALDESDSPDTMLEHCVDTVTTLTRGNVSGDILVFLATERDIRECCRLLTGKIEHASVLPLYGRLPSADQKKIFQRSSKPKIVVATNVAETSLTVPGIRYVVDSGYARISQYNVRSKTTSLPVTKISRASADQRKGRCGRIGPGICIRLYSEEDFLNRAEYTVPELKRSNLAEVILQMSGLQLGDPNKFPFLNPPFKNAVKEGYLLLKELGAIDNSRRLTRKGRFMSELPIDPCISRIILEAQKLDCLKEIKVIGSLLAIQDPKIRPPDKEKEAKAAHKEFEDPHSDFITLLNIWNSFHQEVGTAKSWSKLKKFCKSNYLSFQRMREWFDLHDQLDRLLAKRHGFKDNSAPASYDQIHRSLLVGFVRNLAKRSKGRFYQGCHNKELMIFPGSGQFEKKPSWILGASFIETNKLYGLTVASISQDWIEPAASHLCRYSWTEPHYHKKSGQVMALETVSLFGLIISSGNKVNFAKRNRKNEKSAREIFIQSALVENQLLGSYRFYEHNRKKIQRWKDSEDKLRVKNIVADDLSFYRFYDERLPDRVYDRQSLNKYLKTVGSHNFLMMQDEDVLLRKVEENELINFPTTKNIGNLKVKLEYHFLPGAENDGVTFRIPVGFASTLPKDQFDWLVPGLLPEKLTYLLKSLPKSLRKRLVPVSESVDRILDDISPGNRPFLPTVEQSILKLFRFQVNRSDWTTDYPLHLQPRFVLFNEDGDECYSGRNLPSLVSSLAEHTVCPPGESAMHSNRKDPVIEKWDNTEHRSWCFEGLPGEIISYTKTGEVANILHTTLRPERERGTVAVTFETDGIKARTLNRSGNLFLLALQFKDHLRSLKKLCSTSLSGPSTLLFRQLGKNRNELVVQAVEYIMHHLVYPLPPGILTRSDFEEKVGLLQQKGLFTSGRNYLEQIMVCLRKRREVEEQIETVFKKARSKGHFLPPVKDQFTVELSAILPPDFLFLPSPKDFTRVKRQLDGLAIRVERFYVNPAKDEQKALQLKPYQAKLKELLTRNDQVPEDAVNELKKFQEMVDDYKLALFSPEIKGDHSVSSKKLDQQWRKTLTVC